MEICLCLISSVYLLTYPPTHRSVFIHPSAPTIPKRIFYTSHGLGRFLLSEVDRVPGENQPLTLSRFLSACQYFTDTQIQLHAHLLAMEDILAEEAEIKKYTHE